MVAGAVLRSRDISSSPVWNYRQFLARARAEGSVRPRVFVCVYMCVSECEYGEAAAAISGRLRTLSEA